MSEILIDWTRVDQVVQWHNVVALLVYFFMERGQTIKPVLRWGFFGRERGGGPIKDRERLIKKGGGRWVGHQPLYIKNPL